MTLDTKWSKVPHIRVYSYPRLPYFPPLFSTDICLFSSNRAFFKRSIVQCKTWAHWDTSGRFSKLPYLGMKLCHWQKFQKLHLCSLSEIKVIFALRPAVSEIQADCQHLPHLGMKLGNWPKFQKLHIYSLSTPEGRNWTYFWSTVICFRDLGRFSKLPYLGMKGNWLKFQKLNILSTPGGRKWFFFSF